VVSANVKLRLQGSDGTITQLGGAVVTDFGRVRFYLVPIAISSDWSFGARLSANGRRIAGAHLLRELT
jgi:hypothetical protein